MQSLRATSDIEVKLSPLSDVDLDQYTAFLLNNEDSLIYYSLAFKSFLADLLSSEPEYWIARQNRQITGILPMMSKEGPWGRVINSLPFYGSNGGVLAVTAEAEAALAMKFCELASVKGVTAATWICHPLRSSPCALVPHNMEDERIGQFTRLTFAGDPAKELLEKIDSSARRNIRKAEMSGMRVAIRNDHLDFLERVHRENMEQIGGKPKTSDFFRVLPLHFTAGKDYNLYVAEREGKPAAALLLFYFHRTVEYYIPATLESERQYQPMALILWQAMHEAANAGYRLWNWGGTWLSQEGVYRFKKKWAAEDHRYKYLIQLNDRSLLERTATDLLNSYPEFFVVPFNQLIPHGG